MKEHEFAILHDIDGIQFLVDTDYCHDKEEFSLRFKFWASYINGYATLTLKWTDDKENDFKESFIRFKSADYCKEWINKINK